MANIKSPFAGLAAALSAHGKKNDNETPKTEEVKQETPAQVAKSELNLVDETKPLFKESREITIAGALPGIALEKMAAAFGEPVDRGDNIFTFGKGMAVEVDAKNYVRPKVKQQIFQIALEVVAGVGAVSPGNFFRVVDKTFRRVGLDVTGGRLRRRGGKFMSVAVAQKDNSFARHAQKFQRVDSFIGANFRRLLEVAVSRIRYENFSLCRRQSQNHIARDVDFVVGVRSQNQNSRPEITFVEKRIARRQNFFGLSVCARQL